MLSMMKGRISPGYVMFLEFLLQASFLHSRNCTTCNFTTCTSSYSSLCLAKAFTGAEISLAKLQFLDQHLDHNSNRFSM